jgi:hypothetical protein
MTNITNGRGPNGTQVQRSPGFNVPPDTGPPARPLGAATAWYVPVSNSDGFDQIVNNPPPSYSGGKSFGSFKGGYFGDKAGIEITSQDVIPLRDNANAGFSISAVAVVEVTSTQYGFSALIGWTEESSHMIYNLNDRNQWVAGDQTYSQYVGIGGTQTTETYVEQTITVESNSSTSYWSGDVSGSFSINQYDTPDKFDLNFVSVGPNDYAVISEVAIIESKSIPSEIRKYFEYYYK